MANQINGICRLPQCFRIADKSQYLTCITEILFMVLWIILFVLALFIAIRRYLYKKKILHSLKQIIILLIIIDLLWYFAFNWTRSIDWMYFQVYYFQYVYICTLIYYFGRKSIMIVSIYQENENHFIDPFLALKILKLFHFGTVLIFTQQLILNYVDYFEDTKFSLCGAHFFNIIRTIGFFLQVILVLIVNKLQNLMKSIQQTYYITNQEDIVWLRRNRQHHKELIQLIIVNLLGGFLLFLENVGYQLQEQNLPSGNKCPLINTQNTSFNNVINSILYLIIQFVSFYLPYILTIKIFWFDKTINSSSQSKISDIENYSIVINDFQQSNENIES